MDEVLCGLSAFRFHRIPPQVLMLCPPLTSVKKHDVLQHPLVQEILGSPLHILVTDKKDRRKNLAVLTQLWSQPFPPEAIRETMHDVQVTSPLFTLLLLAPKLSETHLAMAMFEFCGTFSVFKPSSHVEEALRRSETERVFPRNFGWERVKDSSNKPTDLWRRPPLVDLDELRDYAETIQGLYGSKKFRSAVKAVTGITASPFEAQLSLLWRLPRRKGGKNLAGFSNNAEIRLTHQAKLVYPKLRCYGDLFWEGDDEHAPVDVECQGAVVHNDSTSFISDSDRITALSSMGIEVIPITYKQIVSPSSFNAVSDLVAHKLGVKKRRNQCSDSELERKLRQELFIDWNTLGT
ncbi:hypothetical protein [Collinsella provencensis]|uniref:hypothetical protein n=1 Tax=Collinsella provencensis TaxID=1937461 RepID=UPI00131DF94F|nr:hypothetical protein [Collinsella provencensis]